MLNPSSGHSPGEGSQQLAMILPPELAPGRHSRDEHPGVKILCAIYQRGVDRTRALAILEHFGSVAAFQRATLKERMKVPGIGRTLAKRFDLNMELPYKKG